MPVRQLVNITITPSSASVPAGGMFTFTATGTFNQPPNTVTPLEAIWTVTLSDVNAPGCPNRGVCINNGLILCNAYTGGATIKATAPVDPNALVNDPTVKTVTGTAQLTCT